MMTSINKYTYYFIANNSSQQRSRQKIMNYQQQMQLPLQYNQYEYEDEDYYNQQMSEGSCKNNNKAAEISFEGLADKTDDNTSVSCIEKMFQGIQLKEGKWLRNCVYMSQGQIKNEINKENENIKQKEKSKDSARQLNEPYRAINCKDEGKKVRFLKEAVGKLKNDKDTTNQSHENGVKSKETNFLKERDQFNKKLQMQLSSYKNKHKIDQLSLRRAGSIEKQEKLPVFACKQPSSRSQIEYEKVLKVCEQFKARNEELKAEIEEYKIEIQSKGALIEEFQKRRGPQKADEYEKKLRIKQKQVKKMESLNKQRSEYYEKLFCEKDLQISRLQKQLNKKCIQICELQLQIEKVRERGQSVVLKLQEQQQELREILNEKQEQLRKTERKIEERENKISQMLKEVNKKNEAIEKWNQAKKQVESSKQKCKQAIKKQIKQSEDKEKELNQQINKLKEQIQNANAQIQEKGEVINNLLIQKQESEEKLSQQRKKNKQIIQKDEQIQFLLHQSDHLKSSFANLADDYKRKSDQVIRIAEFISQGISLMQEFLNQPVQSIGKSSVFNSANSQSVSFSSIGRHKFDEVYLKYFINLIVQTIQRNKLFLKKNEAQIKSFRDIYSMQLEQIDKKMGYLMEQNKHLKKKNQASQKQLKYQLSEQSLSPFVNSTLQNQRVIQKHFSTQNLGSGNLNVSKRKIKDQFMSRQNDPVLKEVERARSIFKQVTLRSKSVGSNLKTVIPNLTDPMQKFSSKSSLSWKKPVQILKQYI